jgi:nucleoside diphosphate kinase
VYSGLLGDIVSEIQESGFQITAMQMFYMEHPDAEEFYEIYKGVVAEYSVSGNGHMMPKCQTNYTLSLISQLVDS